MNKIYFNKIFTLIGNSILAITLIHSLSAFSQETPGLTFGGTNNDLGISFCRNNGEYILAANTRSYGEGSTDFYIICLNENFTPKWTKVIGNKYQDIARSIIAVDDGYIIAGNS